MMQLNLQTFSGWVQTAALAAQGALKTLRFNVGSIELALAEAASSIADWLQSLVIQAVATTRLSTSQNNDVDTFLADYGLTRLPAVASTGTVTLSCITAPMSNILIPVGAQIAAVGGAPIFSVVADTTQTAWSPTNNAYVLAAGVLSINVTVQCDTAGTVGNVAANTISVIQSQLPGIDVASNATPFADGVDVETDDAAKTRFKLFIQGLKQGTKAAVFSVLENIQQGIQYTYTENLNYNGTANPGYFYVVIDNGSGTPPSSLLSSAVSVIDAVRPAGVGFGVFAPIVQTANVAVSVTTQPGYTSGQVAANVQAAITAFINGLPLGQSLYYTRLYAVIYAVSGVLEATGLTINGTTSDVAATAQVVVKAGTVVLS